MTGRQTSITAFARNERGTILVFWAVCLAVVLGIVALSFDLGRASITKAELQSFADSVALAAAGELDGNDDAITRAEAAAELIVDSQSFGNTDRLLEGADSYTLTFFRSLPPVDTTAMTDETTDPRRAAFVRVTVNPTVVESTFGAAFAALTDRPNRDFNLGATAVAGLSIYACDITPMMVCLPSADYRAEENIGDMILMRTGGNSAAWAPGDFGFLDPTRTAFINPAGPCAGLNGARELGCLIGGLDQITQCFSQRGVDTEPGQKVGLEDSFFNVRFDIYESIMNGRRNDPNYAPAPNVIKGQRPQGAGGCNLTASPTTRKLPRDTCFPGCGRFGDGNWSAGRTEYVAFNYGGIDPHPTAVTRYQYYLAEIARAGSGPILTGRPETGRPTCNPHPAPPDRRVITVAGVDCAANNIRGRATDVPVQEFFKVFLTEPVDSFQIYGEIVGSAELGTGASGTGGLVRDVVQLYR